MIEQMILPILAIGIIFMVAYLLIVGAGGD
jgi:hypothetical protein